MDIRRHRKPGKAIVRFDDAQERQDFGKAAPVLSAENFRRLNAEFMGLLSAGITRSSVFYDQDDAVYPQEVTFRHRVLGAVVGRLTEVMRGQRGEDAEQSRDMAQTIGGYLMEQSQA
jgi:hypothetical protein